MERIRSHPRMFIAGTLLLVLLGVLAFKAAGTMAQSEQPTASFGLTWDVFANGGTTMTSTHYIMQSTVGQPLTAVSTSPDLHLKSGFWYGIQEVFHRVLLPLLNRNH